MATAEKCRSAPPDDVIESETICLLPTNRTVSILRTRILTVLVQILLMSVGITYWTVLTQYLVDRLAREAGYTNLSSTHHCTSNSSDLDTKHENEIQKQVADLLTNFNFVQTIPTFFACFLVGSYSDYIGRRVMLLLPLFTGFLVLAIICLVIKFNLDVNLLYLGFVLDGVVGSWPAIIIQEYCITADISATEDLRTVWMFTIPCVGSIVLAGVMLGTSVLIQTIGFFYASLLLAVLALLNFLITLLFLQNTLVHKPAIRVWNPVFHCRRLFGIYVSDGSKRLRATRVVCLLIFVFAVSNELNITKIDSLYQLHEPFCWDSVTIGAYAGIRYAGANIIGAIWMAILRQYLSTEVLAMIGVGFQATAYGFECLIKESWQFYIVPALLIPNAVSVPLIRSMMSLLVTRDQQGAVFSSVAVVETASLLATGTAYSQLYGATVSTVPGAVYLLMFSIGAVSIVFFIIYFLIREKRKKGDGKLTTGEEEKPSRQMINS